MATKTCKSNQGEQSLAATAHEREQKRLRQLLQEALREYGKPKMSLEELQALLGTQMGDRSLSEEVIKMRQEGY